NSAAPPVPVSHRNGRCSISPRRSAGAARRKAEWPAGTTLSTRSLTKCTTSPRPSTVRRRCELQTHDATANARRRKVQVKRAYLPPEESDGERILVDRLWPRGLRREDAAIDLWVKEVAPSAELRRWFNHEPERWDEFRRRYFVELEGN